LNWVAVAAVKVTGAREPSVCGKFTVNEPPESVPKTVAPPLKLSLMVDPLNCPETEMVSVDTDWLGGYPESVSTWAVPERF
jgi:hypothetical protein